MKKIYKKPEIKKIDLDNSMSLFMMTTTPPNPDPRGGSKGSGDSPFDDDKPFG
jgi:hypothetical protein